MALVTRRYSFVGPSAATLERFIDPPVSFAGVFPIVIKDITIDDTMILDLDELMMRLGFAFSPNASPKEVFQYVASGLEANPFTVPLPAARASANYNVQVSLMRAGANAIKLLSIVDGTLTVAQFDVELSDDIQAGDTLMFTVEDLTT